ncbi:MAG: hypothetical protein DELT_01896 [Desulfovibrio sp.]
MDNRIDMDELEKIDQFMARKNCVSMTSSKYRTDLLYFLANNADTGQYVCEVGPYKGGLTVQLAYACKQLNKKLIVCEMVQECADSVQESLNELGFAEFAHIHVMPFVDFAAQDKVPSGTILTIIDANHIYPYALQNFQAFRAIRNKSYAVAFHDFGLRDTDNIMGVERAVRETFPNDAIYFIGSNTAFTPCELHTAPAEDKTFFSGSEGALILLPPQQVAVNTAILAFQEKLLRQSHAEQGCLRRLKRVAKKVFTPEAAAVGSGMPEGPLTVGFDSVALTYGSFGRFFTLEHDVGVGKAIRETGVWGWDHVQLFKRIVKEGDTVFDVGANIGHHSVCLAQAAGRTGKVFAFEPQLPVFHILCANAMINACNTIYPFRVVVGEKSGVVELPALDYAKDENFGAMCIENKAQRHENPIPKISIDDFVHNPTNAVASVNFIKIDVQTFELFVLQGAGETLAKHKPHLFIEISPYWMKKINNYDYREIYALLHSNGYLVFTPELVLEQNIPDFSLGESSAAIEWDILAVHKDSPLARELSQSHARS